MVRVIFQQDGSKRLLGTQRETGIKKVVSGKINRDSEELSQIEQLGIIAIVPRIEGVILTKTRSHFEKNRGDGNADDDDDNTHNNQKKGKTKRREKYIIVHRIYLHPTFIV